MRNAGVTIEQYSERSKSGNGRRCWDWGEGCGRGTTVNIANPVTFKSSLVGSISSSFMVNASE
jgi:hypothetical protein